MKIGIVGGGIMGISLGDFLSQQGVQVEIFEASSSLGGLAGPLVLEDSTIVDRFYHVILSSDSHLNELCAELDLVDQLRFRETKMGFYHQGKIYSMNNVVEFLRFPPLGWIDRFRLGLTVLYAQFVRDWHRLEGISVEHWLVRLSGRRTFENIWRPLLRAKFDGGFDNTPATYIWSRLVRMKSTRSGANQKEEAGYLIGGFIILLQAMAERIEAAGGKVYLDCPVQEIVTKQGRACGVRLKQEIHPFDAIVVTSQVPIFRQLISHVNQDYDDFLSKTDYLGVVCPLLVLDRPLTGFWTLNITDDHIPFTGIIETTTYIDPQDVGGHHLVYLPKYTAPGSHWQQMSDEQIREIWLQHLEVLFPHFERDWIRYFPVNRTLYVDPLHGLNSTHLIPEIKTPIENLYLATTAQIYPATTNGESVTQHVRQVAQIIFKDSLATVPSSARVQLAEIVSTPPPPR
jgi:protoporphyrinogen oxidase